MTGSIVLMSYFKKSFRYVRMVAVCIIRLTWLCPGTIASWDFGIGERSAETSPPSSL